MLRLLIFLLFFPLFSLSQVMEDELKYFITKDSLVGVKNKKGEEIIPAEFTDAKFLNIKHNKVIKDKLIFFLSHKEKTVVEPNAIGFIYDREGNFLFHPFKFDNWIDYFEEGMMRFVKNNKVGFADRSGSVVIAPKYDFVSPFNYGYSLFCNGCYWKCFETSCEHRYVVGGEWGVMDKKGNIVLPLSERISEDNVEIEGKYYPNPFLYTDMEQQILDFFRKQEIEIADAYYNRFSNAEDITDRKLYFEIVAKPNIDYPYYEIYTYDFNKSKIDDLSFLVSEDSRKIYYTLYGDKKISFGRWKKKIYRK